MAKTKRKAGRPKTNGSDIKKKYDVLQEKHKLLLDKYKGMVLRVIDSRYG